METDRASRGERAKRLFTMIGLALGGLIVGYLVAYVMQASARRELQSQLEAETRQLQEARTDLRLHGLQTRVGAAITEATRGNYERARQLMSSFYQELDSIAPALTDPGAQEGVRAAMRDRDSMITLLSRAAPESVARLMLLYSRLYVVFDAFGRSAPDMITPPAEDTAAGGSSG